MTLMLYSLRILSIIHIENIAIAHYLLSYLTRIHSYHYIRLLHQVLLTDQESKPRRVHTCFPQFLIILFNYIVEYSTEFR